VRRCALLRTSACPTSLATSAPEGASWSCRSVSLCRRCRARTSVVQQRRCGHSSDVRPDVGRLVLGMRPTRPDHRLRAGVAGWPGVGRGVPCIRSGGSRSLRRWGPFARGGGSSARRPRASRSSLAACDLRGAGRSRPRAVVRAARGLVDSAHRLVLLPTGNVSDGGEPAWASKVVRSVVGIERLVELIVRPGGARRYGPTQ
jgi:hypothetical protein